MKMTGVIANAVAIIVCALIGCFIQGRLTERYRNILNSVLALAVIFNGASTTISNLTSEGANPVLYIVSLVIGSLIGEFFDIEGKLEFIGDTLQKAVGSKGGSVSQGFVTASLTFCIGTMAIMGSIQSGIMGEHTILFTKSIIDGVASVVYASTLGIGVMFSGIAILIYEGLLTLFASFIEPFITADMLREISIIGGILIAAIGVNMLGNKKFKAGNMLPAVVIPVLFYLPHVQMVFKALANLIH